MAKINLTYDAEDAIPDGYADLYTEKNGTWALTGVVGLKSSKDTDALQTSLGKERTAHKATKAKLKVWGDLDHDEVQTKLDRIDELELASGNKLDKAGIDTLVEQKLDAKLKKATGPLERKITKLEETNSDLTATNATLTTAGNRRNLQDLLRPHMAKAKVRAEHESDVFMYADAHFEQDDDGQFRVKAGLNGIAVTPGGSPEDWVTEITKLRPGWVPESLGGDAKPGQPGIADASIWKRETYNIAAVMAYQAKHGPEKALAMAKTHGSTSVGEPPPAKAQVT